MASEQALDTGRDRRRVVILAGPSGSGKTRLAGRLHAEHGWPVVRLDDFYRDEDDPAMPRQEALAMIDWDHPDSWDAGPPSPPSSSSSRPAGSSCRSMTSRRAAPSGPTR